MAENPANAAFDRLVEASKSETNINQDAALCIVELDKTSTDQKKQIYTLQSALKDLQKQFVQV